MTIKNVPDKKMSAGCRNFLQSPGRCAILDIQKGTTAHKVGWPIGKVENPPSLGQSLGWFFYVWLLTKVKNKCKQCQKEKTKGH